MNNKWKNFDFKKKLKTEMKQLQNKRVKLRSKIASVTCRSEVHQVF